MGTNYYARKETCEHCHRGEEMHIGKNLKTVRIYPHEDGPNTFAEWRALLHEPGVTVWDEYGRQITDDIDEWLDLWTRFDSLTDWHARDRYAAQYEKHGDRLDPDGYHVSTQWFR